MSDKTLKRDKNERPNADHTHAEKGGIKKDRKKQGLKPEVDPVVDETEDEELQDEDEEEE